MSTKTVQKNATTVAGKWYLSRVTGRTPDETGTAAIIAPGVGSVDLTLGEDDATFDVLSQATGTSSPVGVNADSRDAVFDDLTVREWAGRHAAAVEESEPSLGAGDDEVMGGRPYVSLVDAAMLIGNEADMAAIADVNKPGWAAFFVIRRSVADFDGFAPLLCLGREDGTGDKLLIEFDENGAVRARASVDGEAYAGRQTATGVLPNATDVVLVVSSRSGQGWRIEVAGASVSGSNVGTGAGAAPKDLDWLDDSPLAVLGGLATSEGIATSPGGARLYRFVWRNDIDYYADEHAVQKYAALLAADYRVGK